MASSNQTTNDNNKGNVRRIHPAEDPVLCNECRDCDLSFFDPACPGCLKILKDPKTTISQIFAVIRQWTPQTQQNIELFVKEIFARGAHVDDKDGLTDMTLLHYAAKSGARGVGDVEASLNVVKYLVDQGIDIHEKCMWTDMSALHYAVFFDIEPVVDFLLRTTNGVNVDRGCKEFDNGTALHIGCANQCIASVKTLLSYGANAHCRNNFGKKPLECIPTSDSNDNYIESANSALQNLLKDAMRQSMATISHSLSTLHALGLEMNCEVSVYGNIGVLRFCGDTDFASGQWAGIELKEPLGKNDGSVGGVQYFTCPPMHGVFAPLTKVYKHDGSDPVPLSLSSSRSSSITPPLMNSSALQVDEKVTVNGQKVGVVRYVGPTNFAGGTWVGVEVEEPCGKTDGTVGGTQYFQCEPKHGIFAPLLKVQRSLDSSVDIEVRGVDLQDITEKDEKCRATENKRSETSNDTESTVEGEMEPTISVTIQNKSTKEKSNMNRNKSNSAVSLDPQSPKRQTNLTPSSLRQTKKIVKSGEKTLGSEIDFTLKTGMSVYVNNEIATVRYIGRVGFADGVWLGVELKTPNGKNDGMVENKRYFSCKPNFGLMVRPNRASCRGINCTQLIDVQIE